MSDIPVQIWKSSRFTVERAATRPEGVVLRFSGPFTAQNMYSTMSPDDFREILESVVEDDQAPEHVFDLTEVPYMDSRGLGILVGYHVRCQRKGIRLKIVGMSSRVQELFRITKMKDVLPISEIGESNCG